MCRREAHATSSFHRGDRWYVTHSILTALQARTRMLSASASFLRLPEKVLCCVLALPEAAEAAPQHPGRNVVTEQLRPNRI